MNNLTIDFTRSNEFGLLPYTQKEILAELVKNQYNGLDILDKIKPRNALEKSAIKVEEVSEANANTKVSFYRLDKDGDIDDTTLEVFYYNRLNINNAKCRKINVYPPKFGDNYDVPVGTVIPNRVIATILTDIFFIEFKEENIEGTYTVTEKPLSHIAVEIKKHPVFFGEAWITICSPEDTRPIKMFGLGSVESVNGINNKTIEEFKRMGIKYDYTEAELKQIRDGLNISSYLGG